MNMNTANLSSASNSAIDPISDEEFVEPLGDSQASMAGIRFLGFNTVVELMLYGSDEHGVSAQESECAREALNKAKSSCREYERLFSRTLPHSDISRLNNALGQAVNVDSRTYELLSLAKHYCAVSQGTFDITIGAVGKLWSFNNQVVPTKDEIAEALQHVDWQNLKFADEGESGYFAQLIDPQASIDVGGIAKGWIADRLIEELALSGFGGVVVNLGGNVALSGRKPDGKPWSVGMRDPENSNLVVSKLSLQSGSVVTSGVGERSFTKEGCTYHHILDPATGYPVDTDVLSVTVICEKSIDAEGFSTTLLALGLERGCDFAANHPEILQAFFITRDRALVAARA